MTRRVFYSFHYEPDNWRAAQVRKIGSIEGNSPALDNDWETVKKGGDQEMDCVSNDRTHLHRRVGRIGYGKPKMDQP